MQIQLSVLFIFIIFVVYIIVKQKYIQKNTNQDILPYKKKDYLLTNAEKEFFNLISEMLNNKYYIFPKVRLSDLLWHTNKSHSFRKYHNMIQQKHIDFIICDKINISPLLAIELDDSSHNKLSAKKNDNFKNHSFEKAGLPLLRVWVSQNYDKEWIFEQLKKYLSA